VQRLNVVLGDRSYPIRIGAGVLRDAGSYASFAAQRKKILCDENVARHYLPPLLSVAQLSQGDALVLPAGEAHKSWDTAGSVLNWMLDARLARGDLLIALGGGVIGDLAGFCAAIYQRGIDFIQVPTTLLAQVDSSVGGKTAVNHPRGKNMIGAFHQPRAVIADTDTLQTLPIRELRAGLAEVIKYGMLGDSAFFVWLEQNLDRVLKLDGEALTQLIRRCCEMKAAIVAVDEREAGPRALLNLGHSFGHAIETFTGYSRWLHGEAVAAGLIMAADLSARLGWINGEDAARCRRLVQRAGLPVSTPAGMRPADFHELMSQDKKVAGGRLRLVLLKKLGEAVVTADFDAGKLEETLRQFCSAAAEPQLTSPA
jgi:3-dehydroquinate synthase